MLLRGGVDFKPRVSLLPYARLFYHLEALKCHKIVICSPNLMYTHQNIHHDLCATTSNPSPKCDSLPYISFASLTNEDVCMGENGLLDETETVLSSEPWQLTPLDPASLLIFK